MRVVQEKKQSAAHLHYVHIRQGHLQVSQRGLQLKDIHLTIAVVVIVGEYLGGHVHPSEPRVHPVRLHGRDPQRVAVQSEWVEFGPRQGLVFLPDALPPFLVIGCGHGHDELFSNTGLVPRSGSISALNDSLRRPHPIKSLHRILFPGVAGTP